MADKPEVKALLLDINSPGGTVASVQDIYDAVIYFKTQKKPVVAMFRDVAASGGFYVAMAADKIVAQPGTITGSIGVIMQGSNIEGLMQKIGVKTEAIKSGKFKDTGSAYRPMTDEERELLQTLINDTYAQFFDVVKAHYPNIPEGLLKEVADGRIFSGAQAKSYGLVDALGGEDAAKQILTELSGIKDLKLLTPDRQTGVMEIISLIEGKTSVLSAAVEGITTPRIAYQWI